MATTTSQQSVDTLNKKYDPNRPETATTSTTTSVNQSDLDEQARRNTAYDLATSAQAARIASGLRTSENDASSYNKIQEDRNSGTILSSQQRQNQSSNEEQARIAAGGDRNVAALNAYAANYGASKSLEGVLDTNKTNYSLGVLNNQGQLQQAIQLGENSARVAKIDRNASIESARINRAAAAEAARIQQFGLLATSVFNSSSSGGHRYWD